MPPGIPVATMAVGKAGAKNAAIFAVQVLQTGNPGLTAALKNYKKEMAQEVYETLMEKMGKKGTVHYYPEFLRPFFKIVTVDGLQVKGTIGNNKFEVIYPRINKQGKKINFETHLKKYLVELDSNG